MSTVLMVGLGDPRGLFQPEQFQDSTPGIWSLVRGDVTQVGLVLFSFGIILLSVRAGRASLTLPLALPRIFLDSSTSTSAAPSQLPGLPCPQKDPLSLLSPEGLET